MRCSVSTEKLLGANQDTVCRPASDQWGHECLARIWPKPAAIRDGCNAWGMSLMGNRLASWRDSLP